MLGWVYYEMSKVMMYELHYDFIKINHGKNSRLIFIGTDRLMHYVKTENVYEDFSKD